jgi:hypothetical protein
VSHGEASAYLPIIDLLKSYFEITAEDDDRKRREKVNGKIITLDPALEDTVLYLFGLLGIVEGDDPLAQLEPAQAPAHHGGDQADPGAPESQPTPDCRVRGPPLDRQ